MNAITSFLIVSVVELPSSLRLAITFCVLIIENSFEEGDVCRMGNYLDYKLYGYLLDLTTWIVEVTCKVTTFPTRLGRYSECSRKCHCCGQNL